MLRADMCVCERGKERERDLWRESSLSPSVNQETSLPVCIRSQSVCLPLTSDRNKFKALYVRGFFFFKALYGGGLLGTRLNKPHSWGSTPVLSTEPTVASFRDCLQKQ